MENAPADVLTLALGDVVSKRTIKEALTSYAEVSNCNRAAAYLWSRILWFHSSRMVRVELIDTQSSSEDALITRRSLIANADTVANLVGPGVGETFKTYYQLLVDWLTNQEA